MLVACLAFYVMDLDYILCVSLCSPSGLAEGEHREIDIYVHTLVIIEVNTIK